MDVLRIISVLKMQNFTVFILMNAVLFRIFLSEAYLSLLYAVSIALY